MAYSSEASANGNDGFNAHYQVRVLADTLPLFSGIQIHNINNRLSENSSLTNCVHSLTENKEIEQSQQLKLPSLLTKPRSISATFFTHQIVQELADHGVFVDNSLVFKAERELGPSPWGGWLNKILQKALDTKSLVCDVLPGMWGNELGGSQATQSGTTHLVSLLYL